ncbi:MAG TPA: hypothetical protein PLO61_03185 [Fimbriimonadaceae bacterium]|nr:hypothetical protein [Fimbriimonadaceae bacterium]HRJ32113.1 hypothetical protein [Fimbriimonadaceae bacterium]
MPNSFPESGAPASASPWGRRIFWITTVLASVIVVWKSLVVGYWFRETYSLAHSPRLVQASELNALRAQVQPALPAVSKQVWEVEVFNLSHSELKRGIRLTQGQFEAIEVLRMSRFYQAKNDLWAVRMLITGQGTPPKRLNFSIAGTAHTAFLRKSEAGLGQYAVHERLREEIPLLAQPSSTAPLKLSPAISDTGSSREAWQAPDDLPDALVTRWSPDGRRTWFRFLSAAR